MRTVFLAGILLVTLALSPVRAEKFRFHVIDVGTGLSVFMEFPRPGGRRPVRVLYDAGKDRTSVVRYLTGREVGLRPATDGFSGDVIDYVLLSHPHDDHYGGFREVFQHFDVRNILESKQSHGPKYVRDFKLPAVREIRQARARGHDARFYVVGLPYPNGFDGARDGRTYDEYALCADLLPPILGDMVDPRRDRGRVTFPFGPAQVAQPVAWPLRHLLGPKGIEKLPEGEREERFQVDVLPLGTRFDLGRRSGFTVVHGDSVAALDPGQHSNHAYKKAWPYYREADANDGSLAIQVTHGRSSYLLPGDTEGRSAKPTRKVSLRDVFGDPDGAGAYSKLQLERYLESVTRPGKGVPLTPEARTKVLSTTDLLALIVGSFVPFDRVAPVRVTLPHLGEAHTPRPGVTWEDPGEIRLEELMAFDELTDVQRAALLPFMRERLHILHRALRENRQKLHTLGGRFQRWTRGKSPKLRLVGGRFRLEDREAVWTVVDLIQLAERMYSVDPSLGNLMAGMIMRHESFLDYVAAPAGGALRGERHMIDVADQIRREAGEDVLASDVLLLGHHGSYTSSSREFVLRVDPNVGVISADDKGYSGSTLPDFSALFWNLNSRHPDAHVQLHSLFFHADMQAVRHGEADEYASRRRFSRTAGKVFRARRRFPVALWRTDWNDDQADSNVLMDNILIETDGSAPVWEWTRTPGERNGGDGWDFFARELITANPRGAPPIRPVDPTGVIRLAPVTDPSRP